MPSARDVELKILRGTTEPYYERTSEKSWRIKPEKTAELEDRFNEAFPDALRARTLLLVGRDSIFYRRQLTANEIDRDEQGIRDSVRLLRAAGYAALDYGLDFTDLDYADRTHLAPSGGEKLANQVAREIGVIVEQLGYFK